MAGPIKKVTLDAQFAEALREDIVSGRYEPGARLTEMQLADESELSRGTVRSALRLLVAEGLVVQHPYSGWEVLRLSSVDVWELFTLRRALEGLASRLAAERMAPVNEAKLKAVQDDLRKACDRGRSREIVDADARLHRMIVELSAHHRLIKQYEVIERQVRMAIAMSDALATDPDEVAAQHQPIVDAILAGRSDEAERAAQRHTDEEGARLVQSLKAKEAA